MKNKITSLVFILAALILTACSDTGGSPVATTVEEDKQAIKESFTNVGVLLASFEKVSIYKFAEEFVEIDENDERNPPEYSIELLTKFMSQEGLSFDFTDNRFPYAVNAGDYAWNASDNNWKKSSSSKIKIQFPCSENSSKNDCVIDFKEYEDKKVKLPRESVYLPTKINLDFSQSDKSLLSVEASASYNEFGIPKSIAAKAVSDPLVFNVNLDQKSSSHFVAKASVSDKTNSKANLSLSLEAKVNKAISSYTDFNDVDLDFVGFELKQDKLALKGGINVYELNKIEEKLEAAYEEEDIEAIMKLQKSMSEHIDLQVLYQNSEVGTIKIEVSAEGDSEFVIYYKDGTKENTEVFYQQFMSETLAIFAAK